MGVQNYRDFIAWQKAMDLVAAIYRITMAFPDSERFGLTNQLRRAAVSIPSNIAEGQGRDNTTDFCHFLHMARGSLQEVETHLLIASRLSMIDHEHELARLDSTVELGRILNGLLRSLTTTR